ncbi:helix-turn-helix DNA binding domain protein [Microbacterium phage Footloose]|uniref:Helix-turn-helix DNA binding domain protein n=1 Tax=Microbacterium phage Footloose TaxID=2836048 RepID=A0A8F3EDN1_9CAUD|nr:helix-turn-helix DNA binding domain protein [Microbacterium phage Footloose]QWY84612.1 helix-turn-helix DNA binding domain protein [Microbacterium phage Footloose]
MSDPTTIMGTVTPAELLAFEARHPKHTPAKTHAIRHQLRISEVRYYTLLHRAAQSAEGIEADPVTARMVRERMAKRARERSTRAAA